jgi:ankyrin repeat protein
MEILLSYGAEMDPEAIFFAIGFGRQFNGTATLEMLIDHGADVNHVSHRWRTPLIHAVWYQREKDLRVLLAHGADPTILGTKGGGSALDIAKARRRMDFVRLMEVAGTNGTP